MKRKIALALTTILSLSTVNFAFASDAFAKKYKELTKADFGNKTGSYEYIDDDYKHLEPAGIEFSSGVIGAKTGDFDGDKEDEMLVFYAEKASSGENTLRAQMYEEKDGEAVLAAESGKITNFLSGEKGGGCMFVKKIDGKDRIFMQYTGEINSYADGAAFDIKAFDYDGAKFDEVFAMDGAGSSYTISKEEAEKFKNVGLTGTFDYFNPYEEDDGSEGYGFSPYYGGTGNEEYGGFNIGALEKEKDMIVDIELSTNIFDLFEKYGYDDLENIGKEAKTTLKIDDNSSVVSKEDDEVKNDVKPETKPEIKAENPTGEIVVMLNGAKMSFDEPPYIENGTTRVPMRAIFEGLGANVDWDNASKTVTAKKDGVTVKLTIGKDTALVDGKENKLLVPAEIKNSRTMVPLRFVSEALGAKVDWDGATKTITIASENDDKTDIVEEGNEEEKLSVFEQDEVKYESVISKLKSGQGYAFADLDPEIDLLVAANELIDNGEGDMISTNADIYAVNANGEVIKTGSAAGSTSYPLAVKDGYLYYGSRNSIVKAYYNKDDLNISVKEECSVEFDKDDKETYHYSSGNEKNDGDKKAEENYKRLSKEYDEAIVLKFVSIK